MNAHDLFNDDHSGVLLASTFDISEDSTYGFNLLNVCTCLANAMYVLMPRASVAIAFRPRKNLCVAVNIPRARYGNREQIEAHFNATADKLTQLAQNFPDVTGEDATKARHALYKEIFTNVNKLRVLIDDDGADDGAADDGADGGEDNS